MRSVTHTNYLVGGNQRGRQTALVVIGQVMKHFLTIMAHPMSHKMFFIKKN
jgi:hypothetical protein